MEKRAVCSCSVSNQESVDSAENGNLRKWVCIIFRVVSLVTMWEIRKNGYSWCPSRSGIVGEDGVELEAANGSSM